LRRYCQEINDVLGSARLMNNMAEQATNKVSTIKLPDGQYTQTGKRTLKELFRVHFPDSKLIDDLGERQRLKNLGVCRHIMNRGDWNLAKNIINQSKIRGALSTYKPFKSARLDGIVPALMQKRLEHLFPHLCCMFRECVEYGFVPLAWCQPERCLFQNTGSSIIPRLSHIILSDCRLSF
jgi:hypothetical protein